MPAIPKDLWRALKEIMPTDDFMICKVNKRGDAYIVYAEDVWHSSCSTYDCGIFVCPSRN